MRTFDYPTIPATLLSAPVTNLLLALRDYRGRHALWVETRRDELMALRETARAQSV